MKFNNEPIKKIDGESGLVERFGKTSALYIKVEQESEGRKNIYDLIVLERVAQDFVEFLKDGFILISGNDYQYKRNGELITRYVVSRVKKGTKDDAKRLDTK